MEGGTLLSLKKYRTVKGFGSEEIKIRRSRFISYVNPVDTERDAIKFIDGIKEKHSDATHNVFAYIVYEKGNVEIYKFSDDREPPGTAGKPILEILKNENLLNSVIVVTRYFGGTLLGKGGLVRAYSQSAQLGIQKAGIVCNKLHYICQLITDYSSIGKVENEIISMNHIIDNISYVENVILKVFVKYDEIKDFRKSMMNMTNGQIGIKLTGEKFIPYSNGKAIL